MDALCSICVNSNHCYLLYLVWDLLETRPLANWKVANLKTAGLVLIGEVGTGERWAQELERMVAGRKQARGPDAPNTHDTYAHTGGHVFTQCPHLALPSIPTRCASLLMASLSCQSFSFCSSPKKNVSFGRLCKSFKKRK